MTQQSTPAFNLLDEPWLPVRTHTGEVREVGLAAALLQAADYSALAETSPPNLVALYRLLLAVLHRALTLHYGSWKDADRVRWYRKGLPTDPIRAYLEQWRDRFWLFHPEYPFMQVAALADAQETRDKKKPWTQIALEGANGNSPLVFDHAMDDLPTEISSTIASRHLLGVLQFTPGGLIKVLRSSDKAGALANTAAVLPTGSNLRETLILGLHRPTVAGVDDRPAWEQPAATTTALKAPPTLATGPNDRYTRMSRAALLLRESESGAIRYIRFAAGLALEEDINAPDPMACYRMNKDGKPIRVTFTEGRSIWRDLPALVPDPSGKLGQPPAILESATTLYERLAMFDASVQVLVAGISSDQAKLLRWRSERIELPLTLLADPDAASELRRWMVFADDFYFRLRGLCAGMIAAAMPDPEHKDTKKKSREILDKGPTAAVFFSTTERALPGLMQRIAAGDGDTTYAFWMQVLKTSALHAWEATGRVLGSSPRALRAEARAYPRFRGLLRSLELPEDEQTATEATP